MSSNAVNNGDNINIQNRITEIRKVRLSDVLNNPNNPKTHPGDQKRAMQGVLDELGWAGVPVVYRSERAGGELVYIDGHLRRDIAPDLEADVAITDLSDEEADYLLVMYDPIARMARDDAEMLERLLDGITTSNQDVERLLGDIAKDNDITFGDEPVDDPGAQIDKAEELREKWQVESGQLWQLGDHRVICGDCTDAAVVERLMDGERAVLLHADPPYGMGKENEGIENDNLYREKLDAFQMQWWNACRLSLEDNGSVYIWGVAADLWRLWYSGGLRNSERLTLRNEIVWDKGYGQGMESDAHRMYPTASERCLFFMLGEQGFSINADNYWDTWDSIRKYLKEQRDLMEWSIEDTKRIAGHSLTSGCHWFDKSQWTMPTEEVYQAWQRAAKDDGFKKEYGELKKEYGELKKEYYSTRAYFDNTHDNMIDVWNFQRVKGDDRQEHATPKPVEMMERVIKSSSPSGAVMLVPFLGTAPEIIAAENLNRKCYGIEISPAYVAVTLERWSTATNRTPQLLQHEIVHD